ncbi:hypothetical protein GCM10007906_28160 [Vibrio hyugaensis]|uniref:Uncharacterized protein n=1 Tax=Vibrio hyugaensis TaxID=1534743 RepID=A0ABQ5Y447_9VIBR|nr:hypothetical protein [Vibrio hyugaensis]GLR05228.1 hypothetical protein GCM10007906_28160 [Vibrio hyugaensis]
MNKLSNPSRNINQFVYDFSRYDYADKHIENKTIQRVKEITQNASSDDGIKEIQLELLWKGLKRSNESTKAQRPTPKTEAKLKSKSALRKEKKAKKKQDAVVKAKLKPSNTTGRALTPSISKSNKDSWSNAPSWSEVKRKTQQNIDARSKMDLVDRLPSSVIKAESSTPKIDSKTPINPELVSDLMKYGVSCDWLSTEEGEQLQLQQIGCSSNFIFISGNSSSQKLEVLTRAFNLFTYKSNYTGEKEQKIALEKVINFMWSVQVKRNPLKQKIKVPNQIKKKRFSFVSTPSLLHSQFGWDNLSAIEKANLIIELRYRLGFVKTKEPLKFGLVQPTIFEQLLEERPHISADHQPPEKKHENNTAHKESDVLWHSDGGPSCEFELSTRQEFAIESSSEEDKEQEKLSERTGSDENVAHHSAESELKVRTELIGKSFRWPSTIAFEADGSLPEVQWPQIGVLKAVGYTVGAQGLPQTERRSILKNVYMQTLPYVDSRSYMNEWGEPSSSERLKKMAETLASLTKGAKRKTQANMNQAIRDWESDLAWLKEQYYLEHKYVWVWPRSGNIDEPDTELVAKEKRYQSSRDFLIEQYTNKANELCCQICQSALPFKLESGEYFWEEIPVTKSINSSPYSDLILCPNHRAMYLHTNSKPNQLLENLGDSFSKKLSIELASEQVSIFVTELHQKKLRLAKELMPRTKSSSCLFDFSNIPQGLQGVKKLYLYEKQGSWVVSSRAKVIATLTSKSEAKKWLACFDEHRGVTSTITEKVPTPKSKKTHQPKLKAGSSLSVAGVRFGTVKKTEPQSSYKTGFTTCSNCRGDGGINGGCWKCGGSGWM